MTSQGQKLGFKLDRYGLYRPGPHLVNQERLNTLLTLQKVTYVCNHWKIVKKQQKVHIRPYKAVKKFTTGGLIFYLFNLRYFLSRGNRCFPACAAFKIYIGSPQKAFEKHTTGGIVKFTINFISFSSLTRLELVSLPWKSNVFNLTRR
jgi:hypothetical protein